MDTEIKKVTYKHLKKGQEVRGWRIGNFSHGARATVQDINAAFVTLLVFGKRIEKIPAEESVFEIEMDEDEFKEKYKKEAAVILKALCNKFESYEIGPHEMWNGWMRYNIFELARECIEHKLKVIGICESIWQRGDSEDISICDEDKDGNKFWCHADKYYIMREIDKYKDLLD
jgi:hypothetical protein